MEKQYVRQKQDEYVFDQKGGEINSGEIMTIEDDSYTIKQLMEKFVRNNFPKEVVRQGYYDDNPDMNEEDVLNDPARDLVDAKEYIDKVQLKAGSLKLKKGKKDQLSKETEKAKGNEAKEGDEKTDPE